MSLVCHCPPALQELHSVYNYVVYIHTYISNHTDLDASCNVTLSKIFPSILSSFHL